ncbi:hypothetical protein AAFF_G00412400 [Aldrovandia affinis]|uniref:Secreted protein n=1 Tax=Aldrovandia affinis TaxID=143900 RepID=A0AAD7R3F6_9TELE|nr:hypothetical protein AAFF_G00412400 [Aldrovandia affinis]
MVAFAWVCLVSVKALAMSARSVDSVIGSLALEGSNRGRMRLAAWGAKRDVKVHHPQELLESLGCAGLWEILIWQPPFSGSFVFVVSYPLMWCPRKSMDGSPNRHFAGFTMRPCWLRRSTGPHLGQVVRSCTR